MAGTMVRPLSVFTALLVPLISFAAGPTVDEVVAKTDRQLRGASSRAEMTMTIVRPDWSRSISMKTWSKGDSLALILITAPSRDKGTAFLKRKIEVWQWVPTISRVIKVPPSMMMQSWMGSDFTNDDLVKEASIVKDYSHRFLADTVVADTPLYRIEMIPKPEAPVVWSKVILWVSKEGFIKRRAEFYDDAGKLVNVMNLGEIKKMGGRLVPTHWEMLPVKKEGRKTVLTYRSIEFDLPIADPFFSLQDLKRIR